MGDISRNFSYFEFLKSDIADLNNIVEQYNVPICVKESIKHLVKTTLQPIRNKLPRESYILISSGYRCNRVEKILTWHKGFKNWCRHNDLLWVKTGDNDEEVDSNWETYLLRKQHPRACAADIMCFIDGKRSNNTILDIVRDNGIVFDQMISEDINYDDNPEWIHISCTKGKNRKQIRNINPLSSI